MKLNLYHTGNKSSSITKLSEKYVSCKEKTTEIGTLRLISNFSSFSAFTLDLCIGLPISAQPKNLACDWNKWSSFTEKVLQRTWLVWIFFRFFRFHAFQMAVFSWHYYGNVLHTFTAPIFRNKRKMETRLEVSMPVKFRFYTGTLYFVSFYFRYMFLLYSLTSLYTATSERMCRKYKNIVFVLWPKWYTRPWTKSHLEPRALPDLTFGFGEFRFGPVQQKTFSSLYSFLSSFPSLWWEGATSTVWDCHLVDWKPEDISRLRSLFPVGWRQKRHTWTKRYRRSQRPTNTSSSPFPCSKNSN